MNAALTSEQLLAVCHRVDEDLKRHGFRARCLHGMVGTHHPVMMGKASHRSHWWWRRTWVPQFQFVGTTDMMAVWCLGGAVSSWFAPWRYRDWFWVHSIDMTVLITGRWHPSRYEDLRGLWMYTRLLTPEVVRLAIPNTPA